MATYPKKTNITLNLWISEDYLRQILLEIYPKLNKKTILFIGSQLVKKNIHEKNLLSLIKYMGLYSHVKPKQLFYKNIALVPKEDRLIPLSLQFCVTPLESHSVSTPQLAIKDIYLLFQNAPMNLIETQQKTHQEKFKLSYASSLSHLEKLVYTLFTGKFRYQKGLIKQMTEYENKLAHTLFTSFKKYLDSSETQMIFDTIHQKK